MTFKKGEENTFLAIFNNASPFISKFEGCKHLELLRDKKEGNIFFTISIWNSEEYLNKYRNSDLFNEVWEKTKKLFSEKPEAWTTTVV